MYSHKNEKLRCSFCGKNPKQVKKIITGPTAHICNECIELLVEGTFYPKAQKKTSNNDFVAETETGSTNSNVFSRDHPLMGQEADPDKGDWTPEKIERTAYQTKMSYLVSDPPSKEWLACFWEIWRVRIKGKYPKPEIRFEGNMVVVITSPNEERAYEKMIAECIRQANKMRGS